MDTARALKVNWFQFILGGIALFVGGLVFFAIGASILYNWFVSEYVPREFIPHRTVLAQIEPGYSFSPVYPSVTVSMSEFRAQSAGKPYILSYPLHLDSYGRGDFMGSVSYLMQKSGTAGTMYIVSSEAIPDFDTHKFGSFGYQEHTEFDSRRIAYVSVKDGTSYHAWWATLIVLIGLVMAGIAVANVFGSNAPWQAAERIRRWSQRLDS